MTPYHVTVLLGFACVGVTLTDARRRRVARALRTAVALSQQSMLRASQEAEISQAQFTRQIDLDEGTLRRLAMQPDAFWQWLSVTICEEFGMPSEAKRAARVALATLGLKRMARMSAPVLHQKAQVG